MFAKKREKIVKVAGEAIARKKFVLYIKSWRISIANIKEIVNFDNDLQVESDLLVIFNSFSFLILNVNNKDTYQRS